MAGNILCILEHEYPQLSYCPFLMGTCTVLLHHMTADQALGCLTVMLRSSLHGHEWRFFLTTPRESWLFTEVFFDLLESAVPAVYKHGLKLARSRDAWSPFWRPLFGDMFRQHLPLAAQMRVVDSFVLEGLKVLMRLALGLLMVNQTTLLAAPSLDTFNHTLHGRLAACEGAAFEAVWAAGFKLQLTRSDLGSLRDRNQRAMHTVAARLSHADIHLRQLPEISTASVLLPNDALHAIWKWVPLRYRQRDLDLLFDTYEDGYSLRSLYDECGTKAPLLLVARSTAGHVFGAYLPAPFSARPKVPRYYGDGEAFVFTLRPTLAFYPWAKMDREAMTAARVRGSGGAVLYRADASAVATNDYFILAEPTSLSIGGGSTGPALYFDDLLSAGRSSPCETFASESLHGEEHMFKYADIEVYALV